MSMSGWDGAPHAQHIFQKLGRGRNNERQSCHCLRPFWEHCPRLGLCVELCERQWEIFCPGRNMDGLLTLTPPAAAGPPPAQVPPPLPPEEELELETPAMAAPGQPLLLAPQPALPTETNPEPPFLSPSVALFLLFLFIVCFRHSRLIPNKGFISF